MQTYTFITSKSKHAGFDENGCLWRNACVCSFAKKKSVYIITSSETGYSAVRPPVPTRKRVDLLKRGK